MGEQLEKHITEILERHQKDVKKLQGSQASIMDKASFNQHQACFFDEQADWYISDKALTSEVEDNFNRIFSLLKTVYKANDQRPLRILDVGCGAGVLVPFIQQSFENPLIHGLDLSKAQLNNLKLRYPNVQVHQGDIASFVWHQNFDLIICNACFGNFYSQVDALRQMHNLLEVGGHIVISHPVGASFVATLNQVDKNIVPHKLPTNMADIHRLCQDTKLHYKHLINEPQLYLLVFCKTR